MTMLATSSTFRNNPVPIPETITLAELLGAMRFALEPCDTQMPDSVLWRCNAVAQGSRRPLTPDQVDQICEIFAEMIDDRPRYSRTHSTDVSDIAGQIAQELGLGSDRVRLVRRGAWLHDIGKLRVPAGLLDKSTKLTDEEWAQVLPHAQAAREILSQVPAFAQLAVICGEHHERLDGTGYPLGLNAKQVAIESRILMIADCFTAMNEDRPYRRRLPIERIFEILESEVPMRLDVMCFEALHRVVSRWRGGQHLKPLLPVREPSMTWQNLVAAK